MKLEQTPYVITTEKKGIEEKERLEKGHDAAKNMNEEKGTYRIWGRLYELKEMETEERESAENKRNITRGCPAKGG